MSVRLITKSPRARRHDRVRARVSGTAARPRLVVFRSLKHIYAQLIDDTTGKTLVAASDYKIKTDQTRGGKTALAFGVGEALAKSAQKKGIKVVVFDRGGYRYHGRVKALADGARAGGLEF